MDDTTLYAAADKKKRKADKIFEQLSEMYEKGRRGDDIEKLILETIASMEENKQDELPEYIALQNELASFYRGAARLFEADEVYQKALETLRAFHLEKTPDYTDLLQNRAGLLRLTGDYAQSASLLGDVVKRLESAKPRDDEALSKALGNAALSYQAAGDLKKAYGFALKAHKLIENGSGGKYTLAASFNTLALLKYHMKDYDEAEKLVSEAIEIFDGVSMQSAQHSSAYATLASIKFIKLDYAAARLAFEKAAALSEKYFGKNAEYISAISSLSTVCEALGDIKAARAAAKKAYKAARALPDGGGARAVEYLGRVKRLRARGL
jgi:tetratricopeptide (TPR) repeat protein